MFRKMFTLIVLLTTPLFASEWGEERARLGRQSLARLAPAGVTTKVIPVDCAKGESIQQAILKNAPPVTIEIHGICTENVVIDRKGVALRGTSPDTDGILSPNTFAALGVRDVTEASFANLSFRGNAGTAVAITEATVTADNCLFSGNGTTNYASALSVTNHAVFYASRLRFENNYGRGATISAAAEFRCDGCEFSGNPGAVRSWSGQVSLLNTTITGANGIHSQGAGSYVDLDCINGMVEHPCSMNVPGRAVVAVDEGEAALWGAGDFAGQLFAGTMGYITVYGARQTSVGNASVNRIDRFSILDAMPMDELLPLQSRVMAIVAERFSRVLLTDKTELAGNLQCLSGADAWLDPGVVVGESYISGCEHVPVP